MSSAWSATSRQELFAPFPHSFPQPQRIKSVDSKAKTAKNRKLSTFLVSLNNNIIYINII